MKWFFGVWLGFVLICRRIDIDSELLLAMWQKQAAIEIYDPSPAVRRAHLSARLDATFPF
ncbi:MAG: hypothetical protein HOE48_14875 [Candidatus Latescibacteria bacterium]|nr:hypothetical protein [Candidatus Latescibacterota bacterium]MBT4139201.1 hypothetical protein [Candidatus Latescibacterota bacterium]MBT5829663.1 hypothetical protein [Candidatus Latescibacterota bacterium]